MTTPPNAPGWYTGYIPSAQEWNNEWSSKADYPVSIDQGGTGAQSAFTANYNIQQRVPITASGVTANPLTVYMVRSSVGAFTIDLPPIASVTDGDWIDIVDADFDAATHNITIAAAGGDTINYAGLTSPTQVLNANGVSATLFVNNGVWSLIVSGTFTSTPLLVGPLITGEAIAANSFVNVYDDAGTTKIRKAIANDPAKYANGFVINSLPSGASAFYVPFGVNPVGGLVAPTVEVWLSDSVAGSYTTTAPSASGSIVQSLGYTLPGQGIVFSLQSRTLL